MKRNKKGDYLVIPKEDRNDLTKWIARADSSQNGYDKARHFRDKYGIQCVVVPLTTDVRRKL